MAKKQGKERSLEVLGYGEEIYSNLSKNELARVIQSTSVKEHLNEILSMRVTYKGKAMNVLDLISARVIEEVIAKPSTAKLKDLMTMLGQLDTKEAGESTRASDYFKGMAVEVVDLTEPQKKQDDGLRRLRDDSTNL